MTDLLPCPFCGGQAEILEYFVCGDIVGYQASCTNNACKMKVETPYFPTSAEAVDAWNSRAERTCRIVRCEDCKYHELQTVSYSSKAISVCTAEWCEGSEHDNPLVEPNGFCAWGERKKSCSV